jgi:hypothetical protein
MTPNEPRQSPVLIVVNGRARPVKRLPIATPIRRVPKSNPSTTPSDHQPW